MQCSLNGRRDLCPPDVFIVDYIQSPCPRAWARRLTVNQKTIHCVTRANLKELLCQYGSRSTVPCTNYQWMSTEVRTCILYAKSKKNDPKSVNVIHVKQHCTDGLYCAIFSSKSENTGCSWMVCKVTLHSIQLKAAVNLALTCPPWCVIERTTSPAYHGQWW